jgi:hypothetical protein
MDKSVKAEDDIFRFLKACIAPYAGFVAGQYISTVGRTKYFDPCFRCWKSFMLRGNVVLSGANLLWQ